MRFRIEDEFDTDPGTYWEVFWDERFNEEQAARLRLRERQVTERVEDDSSLRRVVRVVPERDLPAAMRRVVPGGLAYTEHDHWDKRSGVLRIRVEFPGLGDRFRLDSTYRLTPLGPGRLRREYAGEIEVRVPLIGGQIEKLVVADMERSYAQAAALMREWLARRQS